jgi:Tfp pilus assembly protein PilE
MTISKIVSNKTREAAMSYCSKCGKEVSEGSFFCQHCGESVSAASGGKQSPVMTAGLTVDDFAAFVGKNSETYLPKFAKFNAGGTDSFRATWHWPAFFVPFWWMLYRRLYGWAALVFFSAWIPYLGWFLLPIVWAIIANRLYYNHAKKKLLEIKQLHPAPETQKAVITVSGGTGSAGLIVGGLVGGVMVIAILAAIAIPQFSAYRMKAYNAAALSDLRNARTSCEAFFVDHQRYPETLNEAAFQSAQGVQVSYERIDDRNFIILSKHANGTKLYQMTSNGVEIAERDANVAESSFTPRR